MMKLSDVKSRKTVFVFATLSFAAVFLLMIGLLYIKRFAPFGTNSLTWSDANNDYLDFFAYCKDILSGKNGLGYSFTKGLGGNMFGVLVTGYFSPLNIFIVFFDKTQLNSFFDIIVSVKMALSAFTMSWFLQRRFDKLNCLFVLCLSVAYGFCQYNIAQASNIFFLEGVYMLPVIMLGTYYIVKKNSPYVLIFSVAYNIMFSWYTGAINCIFVVIWAAFEFIWYGFEKKQTIKSFWVTLRTFAYSALSGISLSLVLFLPTIFCLRKSTEGSLELDLFKGSNALLGNPITVVTNYIVGSRSTLSVVSLFCGTLPLVCCVAFFFSSRFRLKQKMVVGAFLFFAIMCFYWKPLFILFSLFKPVRSFYSRYSFLGVFVIIFISALFLSGIAGEIRAHRKILLSSVSIFIILMLYYKDVNNRNLQTIGLTAICILISAILLSCYIHYVKGNKNISYIFTGLMVLLTSLEVCYSSSLLMNYYSVKDIDMEFVKYVNNGINQINAIKESDNGYYRISQTSTRITDKWNCTANYDEGALFNYWCIASYTSLPDDNQRAFLDRAGYRMRGEDMTIVNTSILPIDSLVGTKYVLSKHPISGLKYNESLQTNIIKKTYENPYALPMAIVTNNISMDKSYIDWSKDIDGVTVNNPFLYQNELYSCLVGRKVEIFKPAKYEMEKTKGVITYTISLDNANNPLYGNLPWKKAANEIVYADGELITSYASNMSPSVIYIPVSGDSVELTVKTDKGDVSIIEPQLYEVDLELLEQVSSELQDQEASDYLIRDGYAEFNINASSKDRLFTSIPYDNHWVVTVNGKKVEPELFEECLMTVPLNDGDNHVEMKYHIGGLGAGITGSIAGLVMVAGWYLMDKRKKRDNPKSS